MEQKKEIIDLSTCEEGDILISKSGAKLKYLGPTPMKGLDYLDHVVQYMEEPDGTPFDEECLGTRTNDGFVYRHRRLPEVDHDIVKIIKNRNE